MKVLIDNGHGIDTPGKRSPDNTLLEYKWTRDTAAIIVESLKTAGVDAELLVPELNDIPLQERCKRVNKYCNSLGKDNVILISIHNNAAGNGEWTAAKGWSVYTSPGQTKSDVLADCIYREILKAFPTRKMRNDLTDGDYDIEANFYILKNTNCPAVLTENFFMDDREECKFLLNPTNQTNIAIAHCEGILDYIRKH